MSDREREGEVSASPSWNPPPFPFVEEALDASYEVVKERGRYVVYLTVVLASGAVRRKVSEQHDFRRADHAGRIIHRNAVARIKPPRKEAQ